MTPGIEEIARTTLRQRRDSGKNSLTDRQIEELARKWAIECRDMMIDFVEKKIADLEKTQETGRAK